VNSLLSLPNNKSKSLKNKKVPFLWITWGELLSAPCATFCFLKMVWYYRGNVVYLQSKEKEAKNHSRFFSAPGYAYGPACPFPSQGKGQEEIGCLATVFGL
jgi:hypothetical protein